MRHLYVCFSDDDPETRSGYSVRVTHNDGPIKSISEWALLKQSEQDSGILIPGEPINTPEELRKAFLRMADQAEDFFPE